jgi:hypothetical protein
MGRTVAAGTRPCPRRVAFLCLGCFLVMGCDRTPEVQAPEPDVAAEDEIRVPHLGDASLAAPVVYDLTRVLAEMEEAVPRMLGDMEERHAHPDRERLTVAYRATRGPLDARIRGQEASLATTLEYQVRAWYDPPLLPSVRVSCGTEEGELRPRARLELVSPLSLSQDWVLLSRTRVEHLEPASGDERDQCRISPLDIDVTGTVMGAARRFLESNGHRIDETVAGVDLRSRLQGVWHTLQEPVELTDDVWLVVGPRGVTRGATEGEGTTLTIHVGLTARPRIVLGPRPEFELTDLPLLEDGEVGEDARILLEGRADYGSAGARLTREVGGEELTLSGNLFRIRELGLQGIGGGKVALEVTFEGTARGRLYLVGTPELDLERAEVHVPDLEFDLETRNLLVGGLAWLRRESLEEFLRDRARIPVYEIMTLAEEQLARGLNRELSDEVTVAGEVLETELLGVVATREALIVHAGARARAVFHVREVDGSDEGSAKEEDRRDGPPSAGL